MQQINAYGTAKSNSAYGSYSSSGNKSLNTQDFLNLLVAQLSNQDVMNPMQDTEFISQMAQFTALETSQSMSQLIYAQYGSSMVGKKVIVAAYDDNGKYSQNQGVVDSVKFADGDCVLEVNGKNYKMSSVMEVVTDFKPAEPEIADNET